MVLKFLKEYVDEHWISRFVKRHQNILYNIYLNNINYTHRVADNNKYFKNYFDKISAYLK